MPSETAGVWAKLADVWHVLAGIAALAFVAGGVVGDLHAAQDAKRLAEDNRRRIRGVARSVGQLERTVRIIACSQNDLDTTARMRLNCQEFRRTPRFYRR